MRILVIAARNLGRHPGKTALLGAIMAAGTFLATVAAGAVIGADRGLRESLIDCLTGEWTVFPAKPDGQGVFGNEVPIVSEYSVMPTLEGYEVLAARLRADPTVERWVPVAGTGAVLQLEGTNAPVFCFGTDAHKYFECLDGLKLVEGGLPPADKRWIMLNQELLHNLEGSLGRKLAMGEALQLSVFSNKGFKLRPVSLEGVFAYPATNKTLDRVVLCDPTTVRSLAGYTLGYGNAMTSAPGATGSEGTRAASMAADDLDTLFSAPLDQIGSEAMKSGPIALPTSGILAEVERVLADTTERDALALTDDTAWNFVILRLARGKRIATALRSVISSGGQHRLADWRSAAGLSMQTAFVLQAALIGGVGFLLAGISLVTMNGLMIAVAERQNEIGTMRAIGARRRFVVGILAAEATMLAVASAAVGSTAASAFCFALEAAGGAPLGNELLASLFGGPRFAPPITPTSVGIGVGATLAMSLLALWPPLRQALSIQPAEAMSRV